MKKWKVSKSGRYYELFLSGSEVAEATLYAELVDGAKQFSVTASVNGTFYCHRPLTAETIEVAKTKAEHFLIDKYRDAIEQHNTSISLTKAKIAELL